jgi:hypothetical protein
MFDARHVLLGEVVGNGAFRPARQFSGADRNCAKLLLVAPKDFRSRRGEQLLFINKLVERRLKRRSNKRARNRQCSPQFGNIIFKAVKPLIGREHAIPFRVFEPTHAITEGPGESNLSARRLAA